MNTNKKNFKKQSEFVRNFKKYRRAKHLYHLVKPSPWPLLVSISVLIFVLGFVSWMHFIKYGFYLLLYGFFLVIIGISFWWRDVIIEGTYLGHHTRKVQEGIRFGFLLFILSEIMFFFSLFWAYFYFALSPPIEAGCVWPPVGITPILWYKVPLLNTLILLYSGVSVTFAAICMLINNRKYTFIGFVLTIISGIIFTLLQLYEYKNASFDISDGVYGSTFYLITGCHGLHVIIGTIFLIVCFVRFLFYHFQSHHHVGFELASWYWHFVDIIWIFVYIFLYVYTSM